MGVPVDFLNFLGMNHIALFILFVLGAVVKGFFGEFERLMDKKYLLIVAVVLYFTLNAFVEMGNDRLSRVTKLLLSVCGIMMTFAVFRRHATFFSSNNKIARTLKFIGKRTLDIYLLQRKSEQTLAHHFVEQGEKLLAHNIRGNSIEEIAHRRRDAFCKHIGRLNAMSRNRGCGQPTSLFCTRREECV